MALIPGSYARAAGLQSEINKVTITRVAGSEVQFRRTIDTYQRDLRYNVSQIGREQKQLKRSMRKYYKKLREGKKERKQREAKAKEDSERLKQTAKEFKEAEEAVKRFVSPPKGPNVPMESNATQSELPDGATSDQPGADQQSCVAPGLPESPDSGIGGELDEKSSGSSSDVSNKDGETADGGKRKHQKVFLTSKGGRMPYFKAKRGHSKDKGEKHTGQKQENSSDEQDVYLTQAGDADVLLPVINEESEESSGDQNKFNSAKSSVKVAETGPQPKADLSSKDNDKSPKTSVASRAKPITVASLDTKAFAGGEGTVSADLEVADSGGPSHKTLPLASVVTAMRLTRRKVRKTGVSYGDLIKLQHTHSTNTKKLFTLVDRLASKHGIVDVPAQSASASLDPRINVKIKHRGNGRESRMSDEMVKQAAVLYSMKYGYRIPDDAFIDDLPTPVFVSLDLSDDIAEDREEEQFSPSSLTISKTERVDGKSDTTSRVESRSDATSRKQSLLSARRDSTDVTSPYYTFTEAASSIFDDILPDDVTHSLDVQDRRANRSKPKQTLSMSQLSEQATKVRERSFLGPESLPVPAIASTSGDVHVDDTTSVRRDSRALRKLSPLPRRSRTRSLSQSRRDSVHNQLQKRLNEHGNGENMAWHSAFGRLKMLHTLYDLSQHFSKNAN